MGKQYIECQVWNPAYGWTHLRWPEANNRVFMTQKDLDRYTDACRDYVARRRSFGWAAPSDSKVTVQAKLKYMNGFWEARRGSVCYATMEILPGTLQWDGMPDDVTRRKVVFHAP